jgi:tyrosyl-tRNA synthetase
MDLFTELTCRGLIKQTTSDQLKDLLNGAPVTFYCGFDPTADSLHIGSLLPILIMKRLQLAGHRAIVVLGNATSSIGDPSGKSTERVMLSKEQIDSNLQGVKSQIQNILDDKTLFVQNLDWFKEISFIDFLRDVGKHFSVNAMLTKDSVKTRLEDRDQGISFTEFSYMLLQAEDFRHLFTTQNCVLEIGGSDQWSNILAGIDLIRRTTSKEAFGLTFPLITKSDGTKFGKTEKGNIWLDPKKTSPFEFFQFFINVSDADIGPLLDFLSLQELRDINELKIKAQNQPELRLAQKALAEELTLLIHGPQGLAEAQKQTEALFSQKDATTGEADLKVGPEIINTPVVELLVKLGLSSSKSMARKDIEGNGIRINQQKITDVKQIISPTDFTQNRMIISKGKTNHKIVELT